MESLPLRFVAGDSLDMVQYNGGNSRQKIQKFDWEKQFFERKDLILSQASGDLFSGVA